ncbi:MAG: VanZ family protein, partial [Pseudomonadota bacterium]
MPKRHTLSLATLLALFALLTTGTFILGSTVSRYETTTTNLSGGFPGQASQHILIEDGKTVDALEGFVLSSTAMTVSRTVPGVSWAEVRYPLPSAKETRTDELLTQGVMSSTDVKYGEENWHVALFGVFFYDAKGERIKRAGVTVQALVGNNKPALHERAMWVPDSAVEFGVLLRLFKTTGSATLGSVESVMVRPWVHFKTLLIGLAVVWASFSLAVVYALFERRTLLVAAIPLGVIAAILVGVSLPGQHLRSALLPLYKLVEHAQFTDVVFGVASVAKLGHAIGFAALAFFALAIRSRLGANLAGITLFVVLLAVATESGQLFLTGRSGRLDDIIIDLRGAVVGAMVFFALAAIVHPFRRTRGS